MITKITPRLTSIAKQPVRANLQKTAVAGLALLAGSSMSGANTPHFEPTDMIIPGGLNFQEHAYYLITKKLPQSVVDRWVKVSAEHLPSAEDQVVKVNIGDGRYIGSIIESPHDVVSGEMIEPLGQDASGNLFSGGSDVVDISSTDTSDGDSGMSAFEIFRHLAGYQY